MHTTPAKTKKLQRKRRLGAAIAVFLLAAVALGQVFFRSGDDPAYETDQAPAWYEQMGDNAFADDPGFIALQAIREMEAAADASGKAMAEAAALVGSEFNATSEAASEAASQAAAEGEAEVEAVSGLAAGLATPPEDYEEGSEVIVNGTEVSEAEYGTPTFNHSIEHELPPSQDDWENSDSSVRVRADLNIPATGIGGVDSTGSALVDLYVDLKGEARTTANESDESGVVWNDDDFGTTTGNAEGVTYAPNPDEEGAADAWAHANGTLGAAEATLSGALSGVNATIEVQAGLVAEVRAEIEATLTAQAEAEAALFATAEAQAEASFSAAAEAEAEAHAEAERQLEVIESARLEARKKVQAQTEQQVDAVLTAAAQASEDLEAQADQALESGKIAVDQIHAAAEAALKVLAEIQSTTGADTSGQAQAVMQAAASAEAAAWAKAEATSSALMKQSAAVSATGELKARAILSAAASAEAAIDAKAEFAAKATLRAEAYAVAKVRAEAKAQAEAHMRVAAAAAFRVRADAQAHIRAVVDAALALNVQGRITLDGSKDLADMVGTDVDVEVTKDIGYIREVAGDYSKQGELDREGKADHWYGVADDLTTEQTVVLSTAYEVITEVEYGYQVLLETKKDLEALGATFL